MVLHLSNDYTGSKVYSNLVQKLDDSNTEQKVYTPIRSIRKRGINHIDLKTKGSEILYRPILKKTDRVFFKKKIKKIVADLVENGYHRDVNIIHAHTWYSDGAVAYELYKTYNIPYIIAIRSTDLNLFYKYALHLRRLGVNILNNASKVVFISEIYKRRFLKLFEKSFYEEKCSVIPNGVDDFWVQNSEPRKRNIEETPQLLFVGTFLKRKNVARLIQAIEYLNIEGTPCELNLIGGGGLKEQKIINLSKNLDFVTYHGKVYDKQELKEHYMKSDIYTMPSKAETFGLVYIEALSQGIPVLFTQNEGIDGFYDKNIGEAVNCFEEQNIASGIKKIIENYNKYDFNPSEIIENHNWSEIAKTYLSFYNNIINQ